MGRTTRRGILAELGVVSLIITATLIFAPRLRAPHITLSYRQLQQNVWSGPYHFVDDSFAVEEATPSDPHLVLHFEPVLPAAVGCDFHRCRSLAIVVPPQTQLIRPHKRRLGNADGEDSLI